MVQAKMTISLDGEAKQLFRELIKAVRELNPKRDVEIGFADPRRLVEGGEE